ncbi:unnamed protein product [Rotaria sp. Silwood1]|nr:unnamed protein product [Rotaria sp. Silwood1]CAF4886060.1 unnamed protein product [Rotaria sp. Silwood1]
MYRPRYLPPPRPLPPPAAAAGAGALGGALGGVGAAVTCICCLAAIGLLGLWATFIPFVAFFKYAWDQETRAFGGSPNFQNLPQIIFLLAICLLTIRFVKRQMSSSKESSNNSNNNNSTYQNHLSDYENDAYLNSQIYSQQQISGHGFDHRGQSYENHLFQQMCPFQDDADEDLPNEIVAELDARNRIQTNINDEDDSVFSDVVQDAFKKYQNEQDELYAQMEECWNYMSSENNFVDTPKASIEQPQQSKLNPDAVEFKPSWLKSSSSSSSSSNTTTNEGSFVILTSSQPEESQKKI